jgi:hypothetical protein
MTQFSYQTTLPFAQQDVFAWHEKPGAMTRLMPPWEDVEIVQKPRSLAPGTQAILQLKSFPYRKWVAEHTEYQPPHHFSDVQISGPFASWQHTHKFQPVGLQLTEMSDEITYQLPGGILGRTFGGNFVHQKLERMFAYRHKVVAEDLKQLQNYLVSPLKIAVTGATGLVGTAFTAFLEGGGHEVIRLTRNPDKEDLSHSKWNPDTGEIDIARLKGVNVIVHLAGENIAKESWTEKFKQQIRDSRVRSTEKLLHYLISHDIRPQAFISASAIGYYGDRGDEVMTEASIPANDFLSHVCQAWEATTMIARDNGMRTVNARIGVVLSPRGSLLHQAVPLFSKGLGGVIGTGKQWISWIALDDLVYALYRLVIDETISGPVNLVAPHPVTNEEFTKILAKVLHRPAVIPVPTLAVKTLFGEMGDAIILSSTCVSPVRLLAQQYQFVYPQLESALRHLLGR